MTSNKKINVEGKITSQQSSSSAKKRPFSKLKIGTKLIFILLFITFFSMGVVGALSYRVGRGIIDEEINQILSIQTESTLENINKMVFDRLNDMQLLISDSTLADPEASLEEKTKVLKDKRVSLGWYDHLHLTDPEGQVLASTNNKSIGQSFENEQWFSQTQKAFIDVSDLVTSPTSKKEVLMFTNTLQDGNNKILGILVAEFPMSVISDLLKNAPENLEVYLITGTGHVAAYHLPPGEEDGSIDANGHYRYDFNYLQNQVSSEGYFSFDGNNWSLSIQIPKEIAYEPISNFTWALLISLAVISVLVIVYGRFVSRQFVQPILLLTEGVRKMQKGDLKQQVQVNSEDEVGYLTQGFNAMTKDLDEKTQNLVEEKGKYKSILESTNEAIVLFDPKNQLIAHNQEFESVFLKTIKQKTKKEASHVLEILSKENVDKGSKKAIEQIKKIIQANDLKKSLNLEITLNKPVHAILALYTKPVVGEDGRLLGRIWVFNDITEEIESERSKEQFIHVASHKLRTPITTVNWNSQMLLDGTLGEVSGDQKEMIEQIEGASNQLTALSKILINVAQIEGDKISLEKEVFELKGWIDNVVSDSEKRATQKTNLNFKASLPKLEGIKVKADRKKFEQVLEMILDNAMRYAKEDKKNKVELKVEMDKKSKKVTISVSDMGIGLAEKEQPKLFTKFFRAEGMDLIYPDGTGLSLFLAKVIVDSSKEKIGFESKEGKGSRFWFTVRMA